MVTAWQSYVQLAVSYRVVIIPTFMLLQFSSSISVPTELTDLIVDFACSTSLTSAASLSLVCRQCRHHAQGYLVQNTELTPFHAKLSPYLFFSTSYHLVPYVKSIRISQSKEYWPTDMDKAIRLLTSDQTLALVVDGVYIREILSLETDWVNITCCRILGLIYTADELYTWLLHFTTLNSLFFPKEAPNTIIVSPHPRTAPLPLPFSLADFYYHTEYGKEQILGDIKFSKIMHPCFTKLISLELSVDDDVWTYVEQIVFLCRQTVTKLDLKLHRCMHCSPLIHFDSLIQKLIGTPSATHRSLLLPPLSELQELHLTFTDVATANMLETVRHLGNSSQVTQLTIDVAICS